MWLKSGLNAVGVPRICPLVAFDFETIVSFSEGREAAKKVFVFFEKDKNFSHAEISFQVDQLVNPFMAINLITRNEFCLSKCESGDLSVRWNLVRIHLKWLRCLRNHFLFLSYSKHLRIFDVHSPLRKYITSLRSSLLSEQLIVLKQLEKGTRDF